MVTPDLSIKCTESRLRRNQHGTTPTSPSAGCASRAGTPGDPPRVRPRPKLLPSLRPHGSVRPLARPGSPCTLTDVPRLPGQPPAPALRRQPPLKLPARLTSSAPSCRGTLAPVRSSRRAPSVSPSASPAALRRPAPLRAAPHLPTRPAVTPADGCSLPPSSPLAPPAPNFWAAPALLHGGSCAAGGRRERRGCAARGGPGRAASLHAAGPSVRRPGRALCRRLGAVRRAIPKATRCLLAGAARFEGFSELPTSPSELAGRLEFHSLPANIHKTKYASEQVACLH